MGKIVYLFELDSVRNSDLEIELGKKKLFEEIFLNDNQVVLTFNQLTDSKAFLSVLENEENFGDIVELFKNESIKISSYKGYRTASQYIIQAIERCIHAPDSANDGGNKKEENFVFSAWPIDKSDKELLRNIYSAFCYRSFDILEDVLREKRKSSLNDKQISDANALDKVIKYMKLISALDTYEINYIQPRSDTENIKTFSEYLESIFEYYLAEKNTLGRISGIFVDEKLSQRFAEVLSFLKNDVWETLGKIPTSRPQEIKQIDKRSKWYEKTEEKKLPHEYEVMAKAVLDMCSNYTTEESINGLVPHIDSNNKEEFFKDFESLFVEYLKSHTANGEAHASSIEPDWAVAARFTSRGEIELPRIMERAIDFISEKFDKKTKKHIRKNLIYRTISISLYLFLWVLVSFCMDRIEAYFSGAIAVVIEASKWTWVIEFIVSPLIMLVIFGIVGSWVSEKCKLHDILESIIEARTAISDARYYRNYNKTVKRKK